MEMARTTFKEFRRAHRDASSEWSWEYGESRWADCFGLSAVRRRLHVSISGSIEPVRGDVSAPTLRDGSRGLAEDALASEANVLAAEVESALKQYVIAPTPHGTIWAYEVDGFGSQLLMDDANVPSLWNCRTSRARRTQRCMRERGRSHGVSRTHGFKGTAGEDIGGPHVAENMIWPMSQMVYALTSSSAAEIGQALALLKESSAGTGFMHESFFKDDAARFTRPWFAWANSPFGELIVKVAATRPALLK